VALISTLLGAAGAERRFVNDTGLHLTIPEQPPVIVKSAPVIALGVIFFANGKAAVPASSESAIARWANALKDCPDAHFVVRGTASSLPYRPGSHNSNVKLANNRADVVAHLLQARGVRNVTPDHVDTERDLVRDRRFNDHPGTSRSPKLEDVARRADIFFDDFGGCRVLE
jgi:OmpA family